MRPYGFKKGDWKGEEAPSTKHGKLSSNNRQRTRRTFRKRARLIAKADIRHEYS